MGGRVQFLHGPVGILWNGRFCACLFLSGCSLEVLCFVVSWGFFLSFFLLFNQVKDKLTNNPSFSMKATSAYCCFKEQTMTP